MGVAYGGQVAWAALMKSIEPLLEPGEEIKAFDELHERTQLRRGGSLFFSWIRITPDGIELPRKVAIAVTSKRLVLFEAAGKLIDEAKRIVHEVPLGEVTDVGNDGGINLTRVHWSARGYLYEIASSPSRAGAIQRALGSDA